MNLEIADKLLSQGPCILERDELRAILLSNIKVVQDPLDFENSLDDLHYRLDMDKMVVKGSAGRISRRIPRLNLDAPLPSKQELNEIISNRYELAKNLLPNQSEIPDRILQVPSDETCILIVVDGLSYHDALSDFECEPFFVDGSTLTKSGISRIVGKPTIAERMYARGTTKLYGYSYWTREENEDITGSAFAPISSDDLFRYKKFDEVVEDLNEKDISRSYIQIFVAGLDNISHDFRDSPPIDAIISTLKDKLDSIETICMEKSVRSSIFMTSDHGILWNSDNDLKLIDESSLKEGGPRWTKGKILRDFTVTYEGLDAGVTAIKYPYITRNMRRSEWGVHGGVSYEENVIPWITKVVC